MMLRRINYHPDITARVLTGAITCDPRVIYGLPRKYLSGKYGVFLRANLQAIRQITALLPNEQDREVLFKFGFPPVMDIMLKFGIKAFVDIVRINPEKAYIIFGYLGEMRWLVERIGIVPFVNVIRKYEQAESILGQIRGQLFGRSKSDGQETTECQNGIMHRIKSPVDLYEYAEKINHFLEVFEAAGPSVSVGALINEFGFRRFVLLEKLSWDDSMLRGFSSSVPAKRTALHRAKTRLRCCQPIVDACGEVVLEAVIDAAGNNTMHIAKWFGEMNRLYPVSKDFVAAVSELRDMARGEGKLRDGEDEIFRFVGAGLFEEKENCKLVEKYGLSVFAEELHAVRYKLPQHYFKVLALAAHFATDREQLRKCLRAILSCKMPRGLTGYLVNIPFRTENLDQFIDLCAVLADLEEIFGEGKVAHTLGRAKATITDIRSIIDLFFDGDTKVLLQKFGLRCLASQLISESETPELLLVSIAPFHRLLVAEGDLTRTVKLFAAFPPLVCMQMHLCAHLADDFEALETLGEIISTFFEEFDAPFMVDILPAIAPRAQSQAELEPYGEAMLAIKRRAREYRKTCFELCGKIKTLLQRGLIDGPGDLALYGKAVVRIVECSNEHLERRSRDLGRIERREQLLEELEKTARLSSKISPALTEELADDANFWRTAFEVNFNCIHFIPHAPADLQGRYNQIVADLARHGIHHPLRFNTRTALEIIKNRDNIDKPDGRPLAVAVYPEADYNLAFESNLLEELIDQYRLVYFETGESRGLRSAVENAGKTQAIELFEIGGHGFMTHLALGGKDKASIDQGERAQYLDIACPEILDGLSVYMQPGGIIILASCSTGAGGAQVRNLANMFGSYFPQCRIVAPKVPVVMRKYVFDGKRVSGVEYDAKDEDVYVAEPAFKDLLTLQPPHSLEFPVPIFPPLL